MGVFDQNTGKQDDQTGHFTVQRKSILIFTFTSIVSIFCGGSFGASVAPNHKT